MTNQREATSSNELSQDEKELSHDEILLEAYKSLTFWNHHDAQAVLSFDKIFVPLSLGVPVYAGLTEAKPELRLLIIFASIVLLVTWFLLSMRYRESQRIRFEIMKDIECKLDFCAHNEYSKRAENRKWLRACLKSRW